MNSGTLRKASLAPDQGNKDNPSQSIKSIMSEEELKEELNAFRALFPTIINDVTEGLGELGEARKRITDEGVGMTAVNDICFIQNSIYHIINKYFSSCDCYGDILDVFTEVSREVLIGQYLDMEATLPTKKTNLRNFTFEKYTEIVKAKATPFIAFHLALALYLAGFKKELVKHRKVDGILRKIQFWLQEQNDFLDCFGDTAEIGKIGNDIENGKCTWLIVTALQKASQSQLKILEENYGVDSPNCKEKVVKVYKDLKLDEMYLEIDKREYKEILEEAQKLSNDEKLRFLQPVIINIANHACEMKYACE